MSAIVCGKRSFFEDLPTTTPVSSSKRIRCSSSTSPIRFSPPRPISAALSSSPSSADSTPLLNHLRAIFPGMDDQLLEKALEQCGNDLDSAIRSLHELHLESGDGNLGAAAEPDGNIENAQLSPQGVLSTAEDIVSSEEPLPSNNLLMDGAEWVELFVKEMMSASNIDDARARASRVLEVLEKNIYARVGSEAVQSFQKENMMVKEQMEVLIRENNILKRAVAIQHERQKEFDDRNQELQHLKQLVCQCQEQLKTLEINNYALTMHLRQAQQSSSIPGRFHPDVF
ncbi:PREDICTED: uncharacterized protein LOC104586125 [Nelumbo nucifera]|uniref:Uncharacterized protein LOC104586125 n=1 Tax=Nelumbo nucifera TaxID=4432 RepID=A0A1U7YRE8_NELNU|nr:PREDICTED: uncharacterized protein LOC104586125 [Nelumbo nucifera]